MTSNNSSVKLAPLAQEEVTLLKCDQVNGDSVDGALLPVVVPKTSARVITNKPKWVSAGKRQVIAAAFASLSSVTIGFITAYSSLTLHQMKNDTSIDYVEERR
ncbi:hypothetical protein Avbf_13363 [Armadillidium vulgare]|nr:hypothetical protein Avbf_13363 [Armadillidium vulgare]